MWLVLLWLDVHEMSPEATMYWRSRACIKVISKERDSIGTEPWQWTTSCPVDMAIFRLHPA